jgi:hypothetical protein
MLPKGQLGSVPLRECFPHEAQDFTPWLASSENLELLSNAVDMNLDLEGTEISVGPYYADIVATDGYDRVVIENQLTRTNHDHLGKVLTYAAGLNAKTVIWIAEKFTEEHRRTVDYLNEVTTTDFQIFAIEVRLFRIGTSDPAPQFQIIARPNDYLRAVTSQHAANKELSEAKLLYLRFWEGWHQYATSRSKIIRPRKARAKTWTDVAIGRSKFGLVFRVSSQKDIVSCGVYLAGNQANIAFELLRQDEDIIGGKTGQLDWKAPAGKQDRQILKYKKDIGLADESNWPNCYEWLLKESEQLFQEFAPRIKALKLVDEEED